MSVQVVTALIGLASAFAATACTACGLVAQHRQTTTGAEAEMRALVTHIDLLEQAIDAARQPGHRRVLSEREQCLTLARREVEDIDRIASGNL